MLHQIKGSFSTEPSLHQLECFSAHWQILEKIVQESEQIEHFRNYWWTKRKQARRQNCFLISWGCFCFFFNSDFYPIWKKTEPKLTTKKTPNKITQNPNNNNNKEHFKDSGRFRVLIRRYLKIKIIFLMSHDKVGYDTQYSSLDLMGLDWSHMVENQWLRWHHTMWSE